MGLIYTLQEKLIFLPTELPNDYEFQFDNSFEELFITTDDGAVLNAIHFKAKNTKGLILYFHGNAGDLSRWGTIAEYFVNKNWDVLVMDYRTYGKSTGKISERALFSDAELFYNKALEHYKEENIIVYGRSLGCSFATYIASKNRPQQLVLETPFYNLLDVAKQRFAFLPLKSLLRYEFKNNENIRKVSSPITILHGTEDEIVPFASGSQLFELVSGGANNFVTIPGAGHNNLIDYKLFHSTIDTILGVKDIRREVSVPTITND